MAYEYEKYITKCKTPKNPVIIKTIVSAILDGIRVDLDTYQLVEYLHGRGVKTIMNKPWNYFSLQMQLLKMARLESDSSLAWGLATLLKEGQATKDDLRLLERRTRHLQTETTVAKFRSTASQKLNEDAEVAIANHT